MNWIKRNWLSLLAVVLSVAALVRCEPFELKDSALEWIIGLSVALIGIGVTVLIGVQIYNAMSIDKLIRNSIQEENKKLDSKLRYVSNESKVQLMSYTGFMLGLIQVLDKQYDECMKSFFVAVIKAHQYNFEDFAAMGVNHILKQVDVLRKTGFKLSLDKQTKEEYIKGIAGINSPRLSELLEFILSIDEKE